MAAEGRATIIMPTCNRRNQLMSTLAALRHLPGRWPIIVIDNGSTDDTATAVASRFPSIMLIRAKCNLGAAACNIGAAYAHTPYVAFCDDSTQWEPGSLERAVWLLDAAPDVAVLSPRIQVGVARCPDPACIGMAQSPLGRSGFPGPQLLDFRAEACVMRTRVFCNEGGYWPPLFSGGQEALLALDLTEHGWRVVYANDVVARRFAALMRNSDRHEQLEARNAIWVAWMRRPLRTAWHKTRMTLREAYRRNIFWETLSGTLLGLPRAVGQRRVISQRVEKMQELLELSKRGTQACNTGHTTV